MTKLLNISNFFKHNIRDLNRYYLDINIWRIYDTVMLLEGDTFSLLLEFYFAYCLTRATAAVFCKAVLN